MICTSPKMTRFLDAMYEASVRRLQRNGMTRLLMTPPVPEAFDMALTYAVGILNTHATLERSGTFTLQHEQGALHASEPLWQWSLLNGDATPILIYVSLVPSPTDAYLFTVEKVMPTTCSIVRARFTRRDMLVNVLTALRTVLQHSPP